MKPAFSIIIPVYNSEYFLEQTLDSLIYQTFRDFEAIIIDDGSTDSSLEIIKEYAKSDNRIRYFTKENEGQGVARNFAIKHASGQYVLYLDADDWLNKNALSFLYDKSQKDNSDIIYFNSYNYYEKNKAKKEYRFCDNFFLKFNDKPFNPLEIKDYLFDRTGGLPFKTVKRNFIINNQIKYSSTRFIEDSEFYIKALLCADKISCTDNFLVNYRVHANSTTFRESGNIDTIIQTFYICEKIFEESKYRDFKSTLESFLRNRVVQMLYYYRLCRSKDKEYFYNKLKQIFEYIKKKYTLNFLLCDTYKYYMVSDIINFSFKSFYKKRKLLGIIGNLRAYIDIC